MWAAGARSPTARRRRRSRRVRSWVENGRCCVPTCSKPSDNVTRAREGLSRRLLLLVLHDPPPSATCRPYKSRWCMSSFVVSSCPQWDTRHRGFISPSELQQLRQTSPGRAIDLHDPPAGQQPLPDNTTSSLSQQSPSQPSPADPQPRPSMSPSQSHARASSLFSFRSRHHQEHPQQPPQHILHQPLPAVAPTNRRPSSSGGIPHTNLAVSPQMGQSKSVGPGRPSVERQQQQPSMTPSLERTQPQASPVHPEIRSVVQLTVAHARKVYFSGPLVKCVVKMPDGQKPTKDDGWIDVWAQLGGTTLSIWDMRKVQEANSQGKEVPPIYFNVTDAVSPSINRSLLSLILQNSLLTSSVLALTLPPMAGPLCSTSLLSIPPAQISLHSVVNPFLRCYHGRLHSG